MGEGRQAAGGEVDLSLNLPTSFSLYVDFFVVMYVWYYIYGTHQQHQRDEDGDDILIFYCKDGP